MPLQQLFTTLLKLSYNVDTTVRYNSALKHRYNSLLELHYNTIRTVC